MIDDHGSGSGSSDPPAGTSSSPVTFSGRPVGEATRDIFDFVQHHHDKYNNRFGALEERIRKREESDAARAIQLSHIEKVCEDIKRRIEEEAKDRRGPRWWIAVGITTPILIAVMSWAYVAGRFPDRGDFQSVATRVVQLEAEIRINKVLIEMNRMRTQGTQGGP